LKGEDSKKKEGIFIGVGRVASGRQRSKENLHVVGRKEDKPQKGLSGGSLRRKKRQARRRNNSFSDEKESRRERQTKSRLKINIAVRGGWGRH